MIAVIIVDNELLYNFSTTTNQHKIKQIQYLNLRFESSFSILYLTYRNSPLAIIITFPPT